MHKEEKIVVITGAARGIGFAIAKKLGSSGARILMLDKDEEALSYSAEQLMKTNISLESYVLDVSSESEVTEIAGHLLKKHNNICILVNNAGIAKDSMFIRMKPEQWDSVFTVNVKSAFLMTKAFVRNMMKHRWGRIINVSSIVAFAGNPGQTNYSASKAAILGFTRSLAKEVASRNITVNAVAPGFIETDMTRDLPQEVRESMLQAIPLKRYGMPDDVANAVYFLASEEAAYITGQVIHINGGLFT